MNKILSFLLKKYDRNDTEIFLKAKFILITTLSVILTLLAILFYTTYLAGLDNSVVITEIFGFVILLFALGMLVRGRFNVASHIILVSGFATVWCVLFIEPNISLFTKLDTIVFVIGLLAVMPLMFFKSRKPMIFYFIVNIFLFLLFNFYLHKTVSLTINEQLDYFFDNLIVMTFVFFISFNLFYIFKQVLRSLNKELQDRKHSEDINKTLFAISNAMNITLNLNDLYKQIHCLLGEIIDVTNFFIAIINDQKHKLYFPYYVDTVDENFSPINDFNLKGSLTGLVMSKRKPVLLQKEQLTDLSKRKAVQGSTPLIWMGVPLMIKDDVIGVVAVQSYTNPDLYNKQDLQVLSSISDQIAIAIDRKRTEDILKESEEKYRKLMESSPVPIVVYDMVGSTIYINPAFTQTFGWTLEELQGKKIEYVPEEELPKTLKMLELIERGESFHGFETRRYNKKNELLDVSISFDVWRGHDGVSKGSVVTLHDVTKRKLFEMQLFQSQKMESLGTLAGGIAHDFNNILSGIFGYSQLAQAHIKNPEKANKHIDQVLKGANRAAELVQQILTLSRQTEYQKKSFRIYQQVSEALKLLRSTIPSTIEIKKKLDSRSMVIADPGKIHQVIMNLCTNAYHAMKKTGGRLTVSLTDVEIFEPKQLKNKKILPGSYLELEVSDTGHGMDEKTIKKAFDPYYTTKEMGEGTGLGLAIVQAIVDEHDGYLEVLSTPGKGTNFCIYFPIVMEKVETSDSKPKIPPSLKGNENVMFVDDEEQIRQIAKEILGKLGYKISLFNNGTEALKEFEKLPDQFDLIITDMNMPGMAGDKLSVELKKIRSNIPILICTGFSETMTAEKAASMGINGFLMKPVVMKDLAKKIREVFDKKNKHGKTS